MSPNRPFDARSLERIEWPAIVGLLSGAAAFAPSRERLEALLPVDGGEAPDRLRAMVASLQALRAAGADLHVGGASDVREAIDRAEKGGALDGGSLGAVAETLRVIERVQRDLAGATEPLAALGAGLSPERSLRGEIERALEPDGSLADAASPLLGGLRANHRGAQERLRARLESLAHAKQYSPHLQDPIVTMRNGRYVLPVRAEAKGRVPGIVHDASATGQTVWIEPLEVVEMGNSAREAEAAVRAEEARILAQLSGRVASVAASLRHGVSALAELDAVRAICDLARTHGWHAAAISRDDTLRLEAARHPLLGEGAVPITLRLDGATRVLLITGPNTGGKTVVLKTVGLLTAMHQAGLPIPAEEGSAIPPTGGLWADIGDDQSIAQSLSTFSGHLTSILRIHRAAARGDLVLLDEAGAGTDPAEGAALAAAIIDDFRRRGVRLLATSHYAELKQYAHVTEGVVNGAVEFDLATLRPTYRLSVGVPGGSQAFAIAERLGLPATLLDAARARQSDQGAALDASLSAASAARAEAEAAAVAADGLVRRAEAELAAAVRERRTAQDERARAASEATAAGRAAAAALLQRVDALTAALEGGAITADLRAAASDLGAELRRAEAAAAPSGSDESGVGPLASDVGPGDTVELRSGSQGQVVEVRGERITIALGNMRGTVGLRELRRIVRRAPAASPGPPGSVIRPSSAESPSASLDLRGARVDEALAALEQRLDALLLAGGERLEVIHGVGTGALREAVRRRLRELPGVRDVQDAAGPGRDGVTIVVL